MKLFKSQWKISSSSAHTDALICVLSSGNSEFGTCRMGACRCCTNCLFLPASWAFVNHALFHGSVRERDHINPAAGNCSEIVSFCLLHAHGSLQCLLFSIIQTHIRDCIAVLSLLLLFVVARVHWQLLPVALGTGNFPETTKSQLMLLRGVVKAGSIKPYSILPFLTARWWGERLDGVCRKALLMAAHAPSRPDATQRCAESHG